MIIDKLILWLISDDRKKSLIERSVRSALRECGHKNYIILGTTPDKVELHVNDLSEVCLRKLKEVSSKYDVNIIVWGKM